MKGEESRSIFRTLINKAASREGMTQARFVPEILTREAQRVVAGDQAGAPNLPTSPADGRLLAVENGIQELKVLVERMATPKPSWWKVRRAR